jgi:hypothetical protein
MKVMGVVLTLAILSGLLIMAVPVSTSAADLSWTNVIMPQLVEAANANVYCQTCRQSSQIPGSR